eukprot:scaffold66915_cov67-Attheya_sp.AAC.2
MWHRNLGFYLPFKGRWRWGVMEAVHNQTNQVAMEGLALGGHAPAPLTVKFRGSKDPPFMQQRDDQFVINNGNGEGILRINHCGGLYEEQKDTHGLHPTK